MKQHGAYLPVSRRRAGCLIGLSSLCSCLAVLLMCLVPGHTPVAAAQQAWSTTHITLTAGQNTQITATATPQVASTPVSSTSGQKTASQLIARINQLDPTEYDSVTDATIWGDSTCSAASMTEVINAYGFHYRLADVLHVEAQNKWITPADGLLEEGDIQKTASFFGFQTAWGHNLTLNQVIAAANSGTPVIVSFPPQSAWPGGHILVVRGGNASKVEVVDSSQLNYSQLSVAQFQGWWRGFSAILTPPADRIAGKPTISAAFINQVLASYHSPAAGYGQNLYDLGVKYGIDPVYALAFFMHESLFGTTGEARVTLSLGNERCIPDRPCIDQDRGGYAKMKSWPDGFGKWYQLLVAYGNGTLKYGQSGIWLPLTSLQTIIPVYAPNSDGNDEAAYIAAVKHDVATWRAGILRP